MNPVYKTMTFILAAIAAIFVLQLLRLQVFTDNYRLNGINTSVKKEYQIPQRGYIYDRKGKTIVASMPSYQVVYTQAMMGDNFDTLAFCNVVKITKQNFIQRIKKIKNENGFNAMNSYPFLTDLSQDEVARMGEQFYKFDAFEIVKRAERKYLTTAAGNLLGYINEVNNSEILKDSSYYEPSDFIGKAGVEKSYEAVLRGKKGIHYVQKDRGLRSIGKFKNGKYDVEMESGTDITLTIDLELQEYAEKLLQNKRGAVVALDPNNGEILVLASSPNYNPSSLTGKYKQQNLHLYLNDSMNKPMYDRAVQSAYPPGSTFKLVNALAEMQMQTIDTATAFSCCGGSTFGRRRIKCHDCGTFRLETAIQNSCNSFFAKSYLKTMRKDSTNIENSITEWYNIVKSFGLHSYFNNDLPVGGKGLIPNANYYNRWYKKGKWNALSIISNGIGQGEVLCTPLQMANYTSVIANQGFYYTPHIVKKIGRKSITDTQYINKKIVKVDQKYFQFVINGMKRVITNGTASRMRTKLFTQAGKTGTSQVPHGQKDHSLFVMFAPVDKPKIAIAVVVENGGFGATFAAPIATLVAEKYLTGEVSRKSFETSMMSRSLMGEYRRIYINELKKKGWYVAPKPTKADSLRMDSLKKLELKKLDEEKELEKERKKKEEEKKKPEAIIREEKRKEQQQKNPNDTIK